MTRLCLSSSEFATLTVLALFCHILDISYVIWVRREEGSGRHTTIWNFQSEIPLTAATHPGWRGIGAPGPLLLAFVDIHDSCGKAKVEWGLVAVVVAVSICQHNHDHHGLCSHSHQCYDRQYHLSANAVMATNANGCLHLHLHLHGRGCY